MRQGCTHTLKSTAKRKRRFSCCR